MVLTRGTSLWSGQARAAGFAIGLIASGSAAAQEARPAFSIQELPRPGYEPITHSLGPASVEISIDTQLSYDSNIYATRSNEVDDFVLAARPQLSVGLSGARASARGDFYVDARRFLDNDIENATTFGGALSGKMMVGPRANIRTSARFDRAVESRSDPEARAPIFARPRRSNVYSGDLAFDTGGSRVSLLVNVGADRVDFRARADDDRDQTTLRGSLRLGVLVQSSLTMFTEVFATKRDFDTAVDISGVNRDAMTYGAQVGLSRELTGRLRGRLGAGVFRYDPEDSRLQRFTGLGFNGALYWSPHPRTVVSADLFRGDVATVRSGASGRTDTRLSLRVNQEVRHNLLLSVGVAWTRNEYRGSANGRRDTYSGHVELERLLNRRFSLFGAATASKRSAVLPLDEFSKYRFTIGVRARI
ncbi:MAG TPA: outer membrane beta-barrel protein [Sphingobium sp.]|nr:outer membrane beta-barrel protein [Sphingobium sp.]